MSIKKRLAQFVDMKKREADIEAVYGKGSTGEAYELAIEAGKLGLIIDDLHPMARSYFMLQVLGIPILDNESIIAWGIRNGVISEEDVRQAQSLDLLGMNDTEEKK